jgi:Virulence factor BrkB
MPSLWKFGGLTPILLAQHAFKKLGDDELSTRSAALSYYFILALFPMLLFAVSLIGIFAGPNSELRESWEIAEFEHHPHDWPHARRCIVARRPIQASDPEPTLFVMKHYAYRAWHTNLQLTPAGVWHFYDGRAAMERRIREIREDYALSKIPTRAFEANAL